MAAHDCYDFFDPCLRDGLVWSRSEHVATGEVYEQAARQMLDAAQQGKPLQPLLKTHCPWIETQLRTTARFPGLLGLWGRSLNYDEHARAVIVETPILQLIGELAGVSLRGRIVHAGLEHTFGYLFSLIETPFGNKRDRWVLPDLDQRLGFEVATLRDQPESGSLLLNLTYVLGRIAFRDHPPLLERLQAGATGIAASARDYPFEDLTIRRVVEQVALPGGRRRGTLITLNTDFVALPHPSREASAENTLLVYSVVNGPRLGPRLMTAFSVTSDYVKQVAAPENQGDSVEVRTRYNAYVEGLTGSPVAGRRFVMD
jgi:hypothetical protein